MPFIPQDTNGCKQSTGLFMCPCVPSMRPIASNISIATAAKTCPIVCYSFSSVSQWRGHLSDPSIMQPIVS